MKLIVTIPAYNEEATIGSVIREIPRRIHDFESVEILVLDDGSRDRTVEAACAAGADHVISNGTNRGLAFTFRRALDEALVRGADVIVNTDADNHYDQTRIPDLVRPIVEGNADIVVGSRVLNRLEMPWGNKQGNRVANFIMQRLLNVPGIDVSSGYRAYSRMAALSLNVLSAHTYTHETLFAAVEKHLKVTTIPLEARHVDRPSRLISSLPKHVWRAGITVIHSILRYKPFYAYSSFGAFLVALGMIPFARFMYFWLQGDGDGHLQSLIAGLVLAIIGSQLVVVGLVAKAIAWNRQLLEDILFRLKDEATSQPPEAPADGLIVGQPEEREVAVA